MNSIGRKELNLIKVEGQNKSHKVLVYALSTCVHCKATKQYLKENGIQFEYVDVDRCEAKELEEIKKDIFARGGDLSFPKIIIDDKIMITGLYKDKIKEAINQRAS